VKLVSSISCACGTTCASETWIS